MEDATATTEELFYANLNTGIGIPPGYPQNSPPDNARAASLTGSYAGIKIGPAMILKVMAGDKFNVQVNSWYKLAQNQTIDPPNGIIGELFNALNNAVGALPGSKTSPYELDNASVFLPGATTFINNQDSNSNNNSPRAFLNWILFDEQFKLVSSSSGFDQVPEESYYNNGSIPNNNTKLHVRNDMPISKNGFLYIYVSNETPNIDVFFDNLQVTHVRGQILEEAHYYPFGLIQSGISYKAAGTVQNKEKTFQGQRFDDDLGLNWVQFKWRNHDPQIGRFIEIDPLSEKYVYNSTYAFSENKVISHVELEGLEAVLIIQSSIVLENVFKIMTNKNMSHEERLSETERLVWQAVENKQATFTPDQKLVPLGGFNAFDLSNNGLMGNDNRGRVMLKPKASWGKGGVDLTVLEDLKNDLKEITESVNKLKSDLKQVKDLKEAMINSETDPSDPDWGHSMGKLGSLYYCGTEIERLEKKLEPLEYKQKSIQEQSDKLNKQNNQAKQNGNVVKEYVK